MNQHGINPEYRERVAAALTDLVEAAPTTSSRVSPSRWSQQRRATWITAAVGVALLPLLVVALVAPLRSQTTVVGGSKLLTTCSTEVVAPFDCHDYLLTAGEPEAAGAAFQNATAWFEQIPDGHVRLTVEVNSRWIQVPVTPQTTTTATGTPVKDGISSRLDCVPGSDCSLQADLGTLFSRPTTFTLTDTGFTVTDGHTTYTGTKTDTTHKPALIKTQQRDGRTLLTYTPLSDTSDAAFNGGPLTADDAGCIRAGNTVLVLPDSAHLNDDGSIDYNGRRLDLGKPVNLGGGIGPIPANTPCGINVDYWWAGTL